jgi:two-component system, LytTR family, response regulator AlgR
MSGQPYRILIVDDEAPARKRLRDLLDDCTHELPLSVVAEASDGIRALAVLDQTPVDVVLLDIRMPGMDGIELARHVQKMPNAPAIVFTTAYDAYAVKAFELNAIDYLLKPIRRERLAAALKKAVAGHPRNTLALQRIEQKARSHLSVIEKSRVSLVPVSEILYMRAEQKYVTLKTAARDYLLEESLAALEEEFRAAFVRIHRNCLVAKQAISGFERIAPGEAEAYWAVIVKGVNERLPISRRQQSIVRDFSNS